MKKDQLNIIDLKYYVYYSHLNLLNTLINDNKIIHSNQIKKIIYIFEKNNIHISNQNFINRENLLYPQELSLSLSCYVMIKNNQVLYISTHPPTFFDIIIRKIKFVSINICIRSDLKSTDISYEINLNQKRSFYFYLRKNMERNRTIFTINLDEKLKIKKILNS